MGGGGEESSILQERRKIRKVIPVGRIRVYLGYMN